MPRPAQNVERPSGQTGRDELLVALGQVDDPLDQAEDATEAAGDNCDYDPEESTDDISKDEPVYTEAAQLNAEDSGVDLLICSIR